MLEITLFFCTFALKKRHIYEVIYISHLSVARCHAVNGRYHYHCSIECYDWLNFQPKEMGAFYGRGVGMAMVQHFPC